jgi:hypothetical protein
VYVYGRPRSAPRRSWTPTFKRTSSTVLYTLGEAGRITWLDEHVRDLAVPDEPKPPTPYNPLSTDPLLRSLTRGIAPADSLAYQSGVVTFDHRTPPQPPPKPTDDEP